MITIPDKYGPFLAIAIRQFARTNGGAPRELLALADELLTTRRDTECDRRDRQRAQWRTRQARSRARRRAEQQPAPDSRIA